MNKIAFISGCDSNYFPMLLEWLHSVRRFQESKDIEVCILDAGLSEDQKERLAPHVAKIVNPDWPVKVPKHKLKGEYLKGCVCRPFIPQIFPGYDTYVWMDADTWIQDWRGVQMFINAAQTGKIAVTGQVDRNYPKGGARIKWLGHYPWKVRGFYFSNALRAFDFKTAKDLLSYHVLLAGMFALRADAPHWNRWQELVKHTMTKGKVFTAEQLSLGKMCYQEGYEFEILPAYAHWLCQFKPLWDEEKQRFIEPNIPHEPIGVLHISGYDDMRLDRTVLTDFKTKNGQKIDYTFRYPHYDGETDQEVKIRPSAAA